MLPTGAALNGKHLYLYLPNRQANVVKYDECLSYLVAIVVIVVTQACIDDGHVLLVIKP